MSKTPYDTRQDQNAIDMVSKVVDSGGYPLYLYASSPELAKSFKKLYPHIEVIMTPSNYLAKDTSGVLTQEKLGR